jgi:membrane associated rhomboid family serine protease
MNDYFRLTGFPRSSRKNIFFSWISNFGITGYLIFFNIAFFVLTLIFGLFFEITKYLALQPANLFYNYYVWTLFTSMFMHAGIFHLFVNMLSLFFIGRFLEMILGKKRFLWLYIFSGIFAGLFFAVLALLLGNNALGARLFGSPLTYAVGASGAIFAIAGVLALLTPRNKVYLIAGPLIAIILQAVIGNFISSSSLLSIIDLVIYLYIFACLFSMFSFNARATNFSLPIKMPFWLLPVAAIVPLFIMGFFVELPIGNMAHLGGFIAGVLYGVYLRMRYKKKTKMISDYFARA